MIKNQLLLWSLLISFTALAQNRAAFNILDLPSDACFLPLATLNTTIADGIKLQNAKIPEELDAWVFALEQSQLPEGAVIGLTKRRLDMNARKAEDGIERIGLFCSEYFDWKEQKPLLRDSTGRYIQEGTFIDYAQKEVAFFAFSNLHELPKNGVQVVLESDFVLGNAQMSDLSIDFDNGLGFQPLTLNQVLEVHYPNGQSLAEITVQGKLNGVARSFKFHWGEVELNSGAKNLVTPPDPSPWPIMHPNLPWYQQVEYNGQVLAGNVYPFLSEDGVFDEPFIFIEGIDFGIGISELSCGEFGWETFISGGANNANYAFLQNAPLLIDELRALGKDIILIDFANGAGEILANAEFVKHAIRLCNAYKEGQKGNVLVGTSMGGVLGRIALAQMEGVELENHCTELFISHDAPHSGANIPLAIQAIIAQLSTFRPEAQAFVDGFLLRPASKSMLALQYFQQYEANSDGFYSYLNDLGFPEECRNVAIVNGSSRAEWGECTAGAPIVDFDCHSQLLGSVLRLHGIAVPGDADHDAAFGNNRVLADVVYTELGNNIFDMDIHHIPPYTRNLDGEPYWDALPGGSRASLVQLVEAINTAINAVEDYPDGCTEVEPWHYISNHSFIPTFSALGMEREYASTFIDDEIENAPEICPFDAYISPESGNQQHSFISEEAIDFVLNELYYLSPLIPEDFTSNQSNNGVFNFAQPTYTTLSNVHLHNGGRIFINAFLPTHYAQANDYIPNGDFVEVKSAACGSNIIVGNDGHLVLGDENTDYPARLVLRSGSTLEVREGGTLHLNPSCEILVERGAKIIVQPGAFVGISDESSIIIKEGAQMEAHGQGLRLLGQNALLHVKGELVIPAEQTLELLPSENHMGYLKLSNSGVRLWGSSAQLILEGVEQEQKLLEIEDDVALSEDFRRLKVRNGAVVMHGNSFIVPSKISAIDCSFSNQEAPQVAELLVFNQNSFRSCWFQSVKVSAQLVNNNGFKLMAQDCVFEGSYCGAEVHGKGYNFKNCTFGLDALIHSFDLSLPSVVDGCTFQGGLYGVVDESPAHLRIMNSQFSNYGLVAISKDFGLLSLKCNHITESSVGVKLRFSALNMSNLAQAGNNFMECYNEVINAYACDAILLKDGFNRLISYGTTQLILSLSNACGVDCQETFELNLRNNEWAPIQGEPGPPSLLFSTYNDCPIGTCQTNIVFEPYDSQLNCDLQNNPRIPIGVAGGLNQNHGEITQLTEYEVDFAKAILKMSDFNLLEDPVSCNEQAFEAFEERLNTSFKWKELDLNQRMWYALAKKIQQGLFEELALSSIDQNQEHPLEATFLDILSRFDDPSSSKTLAMERFIHEMQKANFIQARGQNPIFRNLLQKIVECGMNEEGLELVQAALNRNEAYAQEEMLGVHFFLTDTEAVTETLDAPEWERTSVKNSLLVDRNNVEFQFCGSTKRNMKESNLDIILYPNPNSGRFTVDLSSIWQTEALQIFNALGVLVYEIEIESDEALLELDLSLAQGVYIVHVFSEDKTYSARCVIQ